MASTSNDLEPEDGTPSLRQLVTPPLSLDLVWYLLPAGLALIGLGCLPLRSWDYWGHITIGRLIAHWRAVPVTNEYLYTIEASAPSMVHAWLSEWILYELHRLGNVYGVLAVRNLFAGLAFLGLGTAAIKRADSVMTGSLVTSLGLIIAAGLIEARTHLLAWPIFLGLLWIGYRIRLERGAPWLLMGFPLGAMLWANLHGSFPLAPAVALAFAAAQTLDRWRSPEQHDSRRERLWYGVVVASAVAPLVHPRHVELYTYVFSQSTNSVVRSTITEWWPTMPWHPVLLGPLFYATLGGVGYAMWCRREEADSVDVLLLAGIAALTIGQARGLLWYGLLLPVVGAPYAGELISPPDDEAAGEPGRLAQAVHLLLAVGLVGGGIALQPTFQWRIDWMADAEAFEVRSAYPLKGIVPDETPVGAMQLMRRQGIRSRLYHDHRFAGFLLFHLTEEHPEQRVFVDHRIELPPASVWETYHALNRGESNWQDLFDRYDVGAAVLSFQRQRALIESMRSNERWRTVHETDDYVLLLEWRD